MLAILWRDFRTQYTRAFWLLANFCSPLFYLVFFAFIFSVSMPGAGGGTDYLEFFVPGLIAFQSFTAFQSTFALVHLDRRLGILETVRNSRTTIGEYFLAKAAGAKLLALVKALLIYSAGALFFGMEFAARGLAVLALVIIVSTAFWFFLGFILGFMISTEEKRDIFLQLFILPVSFLSTVYYTAANAPAPLAALIRLNPLTGACNLAREALLGGGFASRADALWLGSYLLIGAAAAWLFFRLKFSEDVSPA